MNKESYTAASMFPVKLLKSKDVTNNGNINMVHIQLNPTNVCSLNCSFCSCANRAKSEQMSLLDIMKIISDAKSCGCKAVTITGGGEPLLHPNINEMIHFMKNIGISVGIVTNGTCLDKIDSETWKNCVTWCRISHADYRPFDEEYASKMANVIRFAPTDWAFSYVLSREPNYDTLSNVIRFANEYNFTHVRIVSDLLDLDNVPCMEAVQLEIQTRGVNDSKVIYQGRKEFVRGRKKCLISILKPVIGADGKIYPCCGTQYALENPGLDYEKSMCMGDARTDLKKIFEEQKYFDGSVCYRCYYENYNVILDKIISKLEHMEFV